MHLAFSQPELEPLEMIEMVLSWDEALSSVPEWGLDESYRRAFAERMRNDPKDKYPMKAVELLAAWFSPTSDQRTAAERHAETLRQIGPPRASLWVTLRCEKCKQIGSVHPKAYNLAALSPCCGEPFTLMEA